MEIKRNAGGPFMVNNVGAAFWWDDELTYVQTVSSPLAIGNGIHDPDDQLSFSK